MRILSIETSCDETGISILEAKGGTTDASFKVLGDTVSSQIDVHIPYGGVFPALAKREHIKNLPVVLEKTLIKAGLDKKKKPIDAIAVTYGPGLEPALWTGIVFAKELAKKWNVPLVPVNHMEGHLLSVFGKNKGTFKISKIKSPALSLLVSGGHTELVLMKKWMDYKIIGQTLDDAVGEAFDKAARMLGLPYPGGPQISRLAEETRISRERSIAQAGEPSIAIRKHANMRAKSARESGFSLPRPMLHTKNFDFSFSGLKTAVLYLIRDLGGIEKISEKVKAEIALEFENAAIECLIHKTRKVTEQYGIKTIIVGGGVSANKYLRSEMKKLTGKNIKLMFPTKELSTDNSIMIGIAGYLNYIKNKKKTTNPRSIKATGNLRL
jgi:N6-L-threonylcarbamoyladenine synthase